MPVQTEQSAICKQGFNNECTSPAFICFKPSQSHTHWHHARHKLESVLKEIFKEQPAAGISVIIFDVAISDTLMQSVSSPGIQPSPGRELSGVRSRWVDNYGRSNLASQQAGTGGKCQKPANVSQTLVQGYPNCYKWFLQDWHFKHCLLHDVIPPWLPFTLTIGKLGKRAQQNILEDSGLSLSWHVTHISSRCVYTTVTIQLYVQIFICKDTTFPLIRFVFIVQGNTQLFDLTWYADMNGNT